MHIDLKLGLSCNNECRHCVMEPTRQGLVSENKSIDTASERISALVQEIKAKGADSLTLTGGEPTVRSDFFDILNAVVSTGLRVTVQTNGRVLGNAAARAKLADIKKDAEFVVAIHGSTGILHDKITQKDGSFEETISGIKNLLDLGFNVCGKTVLSRHNLYDLGNIINLMTRLGITQAAMAYPHLEGFPKALSEELLPTYSEIRSALSLIPETPVKIYWETVPFCVFPSPEFFPYSMDMIYLSERINGEKTFIEMSMTDTTIEWHESRRSIKRYGERCGECLMAKVCEGVWYEYFDCHSDDDLVPIINEDTVNAAINLI